MNKILVFLIVAFSVFSCLQPNSKENKNTQKPSDKIYQYSVFTALANKIYDGNLTVAEVKGKGDLGLGTYNGLNGEMIVLDGKVYQLLSGGTVRQPLNSELVPFTVVTFFEEDQKLELTENSNYSELKAFIENKLPSKNLGYAFKIKSNFDYVKCGGAVKQDKPYTKTLSDAIVDRPVFEKENVTGTIVGFWFPEYFDKVNIAGFHLHFVSDDEKFAGHLFDFQASNLKIEIDYCDGFDIELPKTTDFEKADFDLLQEYNNNK
ncbi:MAG: acetolactate decarboxylase [Prolixibacteraceae bacterium]|jgi:acetolactate decarboxylase|nr:acetolactate decarboxylase [Prolixibacteraceae bacterium]MBT6005040.1 acetolactate decarboxylase [Prolixibacteraceae bacterium]MBT6764232.1 acetolactate decarboxylase [Prolixibacteraceae bacterium]MBT6997134.1 acetolactate decarboxylase [Prolixibacteraceae bacterium]MBT7393333.1 acetolactate decarboxylase [Prolixibacteraceae bacterium]